MNTKEKIEIMQAYLDGKTIEYKTKIQGKWETRHDEPTWNFTDFDYQIKPKQKVKKTIKYICFEWDDGYLFFVKEGNDVHRRFIDSTHCVRIPEFDKTCEIEVEE